MNYLAFLLEGNKETGNVGFESMLPMLIFWGIALAAIWWFNSRAQKKSEMEEKQKRDSLQVGDEITTIGGIIGKVVSIKDDTFVLETTKEKTHIRFDKFAIRTVDVKVADLTSVNVEPQENSSEEQPKKLFGFFNKK